jgi:hypothetical protein
VGDFSYSIDPESGFTVITISGTITYELADRMVHKLAKDPDFDSNNRTLVDAKRVAWESSLSELQEMVGLTEEVQGMFTGGNAVVLPDPLYRDLGELFVTYARMNGVDWTAFNDYDRAHAWLVDKEPAGSAGDDPEKS